MASGGMSLEQQFVNFSKFGDSRCNDNSITLTNVDIWMKQAKVLDGKNITTTDTGIAFNKMKKRCISFQQFVEFLKDLADTKNTDIQEIKVKLADCGLPGAAPGGAPPPKAAA